MSSGAREASEGWLVGQVEKPPSMLELAPVTKPAPGLASEHAVLWPRLTAVNPFFARYVQITSRAIPVVLLEPHA